MTKLKIIKRPVVRYFSIFLFEIPKCSTFIYNPQALPGSLKFRTWCFSLTLYTEYEAIQALKISMTRLDTVLKQLHISLWNILIFHWKIFYLHLQSSSASKKWKNANFLRFADLVHRVRRDPSVTLRKFSPDTTGHGLQITKRPAVWYFSIFLFEKYQFLLEIFYLHLESSSASRKWKNLNVVLFADSVHRVRRDPSVTQKIFFGFFRTKFKIL